VERGAGPLSLLVPTVVVVAVWLVGRTMRTRRSYLAELEQRAVRLERERDALARAAVAEERARIAREMHDVVAHSVAVMVAQAEGASVVVRSAPDAAERALEVISDAGRKALSELRRTLGVLRESNAADTAPQPGLADLDVLVASMRSSGLPVRFRREGADEPVPPTMALAVYRIVQESLTNTLKHAGPRTPTQLLLRRTPGTLEVDVTDLGLGPGLDPGFGPLLDPGFKGHGPSGEGRGPRGNGQGLSGNGQRPSGDRQGLSGDGQGLTGIHERVSMFGGEVLSGPTPGGGWRVHALLPIPIP
jgi:signal transduction histidine kinase